MLNYEKERLEKAIRTVGDTANRILIEDCYEEQELRQLQKALRLLLDEADGR